MKPSAKKLTTTTTTTTTSTIKGIQARSRKKLECQKQEFTIKWNIQFFFFNLKQDYMFAHTEHFRMPCHVIITYAQQTSIQHTSFVCSDIATSLFLVRAVLFTLNTVENRYFHPNDDMRADTEQSRAAEVSGEAQEVTLKAHTEQ